MSDDLYSPCIICEQTGKVVTENKGEIDCPGCEMMRVIPVGINERQLERMHKHSEQAILILHAIIHGFARWEWFNGYSRNSGELCVAGMRYTLDCDDKGLPIVTDHVRSVIMREVG